MTAYVLFGGLSAAQTLPVPAEGVGVPGNLPSGSQAVNLGPSGAGAPTTPATNQGFQLTVVGHSPGETCAAQAQALVSNDGIHWMGYGAPIVAASGPSPVFGQSTGAGTFAFFSAYLQSISGAGAKATLVMNA